MERILIVTLMLTILSASIAVADAPQLINYQGRLMNAQRAPMDTTVGILFAIYNDSTATESLWSELHESVLIRNGLFTVILGSLSPLSDTVFLDTSRYLGITMGGDGELSPRTRLVTAPFSHRVSTVDGATGGTITSSVSVGSGHNNTGSNSLVAGSNNTVTGNESAILGGDDHEISGARSAVCAGRNNLISAIAGNSIICAGEANSIEGNGLSMIGSGLNNHCYGASGFIGGGEANNINVAGSGNFGFIGGGAGNSTGGDGDYITVVGGHGNTANSGGSFVGGGANNSATGYTSFIGGGYQNTASGFNSTISGGAGNTIHSSHSAIPGCGGNTIDSNGHNSMAFGMDVYVDSPWRVVFFRGPGSGRLGINRDDNDGGIDHPIHVGTDGTNGNGAHLTAGGVWTNASSRDAKEAFEPFDAEELLNSIADIPVESWRYKNSTERHIGPVSEDFVEAFDVGTTDDGGVRNNKHLSANDVAGVALAAIKELHKKNTELETEVAELRALVEELLKEGR
ncbi:MAG: tail fiber domain-containing protein [Candidatus Zixiibacteriota bacterium]